MLAIPTPFPFAGSVAYMDDSDPEGRDIVEKVRIQRDNGDGTALISIASHRYPREIASGNRTVEFARLRATEQPEAAPTPRRRRSASK